MALEVEGSNPFVHPKKLIGHLPFLFLPRFGNYNVCILKWEILYLKRGETLNWKIFFLAFSTIFLAELGDKTQLAVFTLVSQSKASWEVFFGASLALALVTLIGVAFGEILTRYIPPLVMRIGAAFLFIGIGVYTLWKVWADLAR